MANANLNKGKIDTQGIYGIDKDLSGTTYRQKSYLIYHSMLHICVDSFSAQVAGMYDKKTVFIPSVLHEGNSKPFFNSYKNLKVVSPDTEIKPSLNTKESIKRINQTKPEDVAKAILSSLNIEFDFPYKTVFLGNKINSIEIDCVPNAFFKLESEGAINIRLDYLYNEQNLINLLNNNNSNIYTNKLIPTRILRNFQKSIKSVIYIIDSNHDPKFAYSLKKVGIDFKLVTYDKENLENYKLAYMDYGVVKLLEKYKFEDIKETKGNKDLKIENVYYISNKIFQNREKTYPGFLASMQGLDNVSVAEKNPEDHIRQITYKAEDNDFFWRDVENFWLLEKI